MDEEHPAQPHTEFLKTLVATTLRYAVEQPEEWNVRMADLAAKRGISKHGDRTWRLCQPVLAWMIQNGDEHLAASATKTRARWEQEQRWLLELLQKGRFFDLVERALEDRRGYKHALKTLPPATQMHVDLWFEDEEEPRQIDLIAYLALLAAERESRRRRMAGKKMGRKR